MYPYLRLAKVVTQAYFASPLSLEEPSEIRLRVWPGDVDFYPEMNNGRQLTMMDLGRMDLSIRNGLLKAAWNRGWGFVVAGSSVRFRRKLRPLREFSLQTKALCRDEKWFYLQQEILSGGVLCSSALIRAGLLDSSGVVPTDRVAQAMGRQDWAPPMPRWVEAWVQADAARFSKV